MNFSELVPYQQAAFSHNGDYLAIAKGQNVFVSATISNLTPLFPIDL